ncbi:SMI1/KNR4 family protein [Tenacibaculum tangerinum]|uniref:SMI1/KNR4 family protein n=1 Tax=Tenacibaculum tangerinum TaxID=3038772 RepID=A0ABY8L1E4_9FLAO|nr:SMI1/KNR4 family protein [Tenacibaculum tangerinum]WGH75109.1 SMI1/KNR4 family protein [Tenacibaculum tangerinum]
MNPIRITFKNRNQISTPEELNEFENSLGGLVLPEDYRQHMLTYNGGIVRQYDIVHKNYYGLGDGGISDFLSIKYGGYTVEKFNEDLSDRLPTGYLAIGFTSGGGDIIMSLNNDATYGNTKVRYTEGEKIDLSPSFIKLLNDMVEAEY